MATQLKFDELNKLKSKNKSIPYKDYFGKMYISKKQMDERISLAEDIELVMLYVFTLWDLRDTPGYEKTVPEIKDIAKRQLTTAYEKHTKVDPYITKHIDNLVNEVVDSTERNTNLDTLPRQNGSNSIEKTLAKKNPTVDEGDKEEDKAYWTSRDRAKLIAENEANSLKNYTEYREAKTTGKTKKIWLTENDEKVRLTHTLVEGKMVDIDGLFLVGGSLMRFPKDVEYDPDPSETVNCRCSCVYE